MRSGLRESSSPSNNSAPPAPGDNVGCATTRPSCQRSGLHGADMYAGAGPCRCIGTRRAGASHAHANGGP